jgi:dihydroorotase
MNLLLKSALVTDPRSPYFNQQKDILVQNGEIISIGDNLQEENATVIQENDLAVSPGWMDMQVNYYDPGDEQKEDITTGSLASIYGGFTSVALLPETNPPVQSKSSIEYIYSKSSGVGIKIYPYAALSKALKGEDISEMIDLYSAGAIAFTDGNKPVSNINLILKALQYSRTFDGLVVVHPDDPFLSGSGVIHEGLVSVNLGMKGIPAIAEETTISRCIDLCEYTGGKLHFSQISSAKSVYLIADAKRRGIRITAGVGIHHLIFDENDLSDFDSNLKFRPPLRTLSDRDALVKAVSEGIIDVVVSDHSPHEDDRKKCEFEIAAYGASSTQLMLPMMLKAFGNDISIYAKALSINPKKILKLTCPVISEGEKAELTVFNPTKEWIFDHSTNKSKSANSIFFNKKVKGLPLATVTPEKLNLLYQKV